MYHILTPPQDKFWMQEIPFLRNVLVVSTHQVLEPRWTWFQIYCHLSSPCLLDSSMRCSWADGLEFHLLSIQGYFTPITLLSRGSRTPWQFSAFFSLPTVPPGYPTLSYPEYQFLPLLVFFLSSDQSVDSISHNNLQISVFSSWCIQIDQHC